MGLVRNVLLLLFRSFPAVFLFSTYIGFCQPSNYQFGRIDISKGLSHPTVNDIFQDSTGFIWFATGSGLNRYDGYSVKVFKNIPGDSTSLQEDNLTRIFEGPEGKLWILSYYGNIVYNPKTENFERNPDLLLLKYSVHQGVITYLKKDRRGRFWFAHYNQGLFCYDPALNRTVRLIPVEKDSTSISSLQMSSLAEDSMGNMWVIHQNGTFEKIDGQSLKVTFRNNVLRDKYNAQLYEYDFMIDADDDLWIHNDRNFGCFLFIQKTEQFKHLHPDEPIGRLNSSLINKILQDDKKLIWIATENGGINLVNKKDFSVQYLQSDEFDIKSPAENTGYSILKDKQGIIWIGFKNGVSLYHPDIFRFELYTHKAGRPETLPFNDISALAEDKAGNIWMGTNGGGLIQFNRKDKKFTVFKHNPNNPNSLSNDIIVSLLMDHEGILWIGTYYGGLNSFNGRNFTRYKHIPGDPTSLGNDNIWEIYEDRDYNIWLGTLNGGLDVFNRQKKEFYHYKSGDVNSIHTPYVPAIIQDREGNMLIGTGYGLEVLNKSTGRFTHYLNSREDIKSLGSNSIQCLYQDSQGWIWIGTNGGLNLFDAGKNEFSVFRETDGLAHNSILTIVEDNDNNLWISTPKGISKLSISRSGDQFTFHNYTESDGLIQGVYHENAVLKCKSGELVFGGSGGFNIFNPSKIRIDSTTLPVILTDFQISNQNVKIGESINKEIVLPASISRLREITLGPANNFFSIEFVALNFFHPEKSKYQYILEGFNKTWVNTHVNQRSVTFTNLDPGNYTFRVKASNSDGIWGENEAILNITILPPFWKSNWAFMLYAVITLVALLVGRRLVVARERLKFSIQTERNNAQKLHELDMMKIKFFTNVSHELRTPLTLIITPLEKLLKSELPQEGKKQLELIYRNARRLLNLVNQLLDFKRMESDELNLNVSEGDIIQFIQDLVWSFKDLSDKKHIQLSFNSTIDGQETFFDKDKLEKIMFNLLSNAFKFTPDHGHVSVDLKVSVNERRWLVIKVSDSGIGIPSEKLDKVFERFYQHDLSPNIVNQGSGIGLSITQEFVKLHGGTIAVESVLDKGSIFTVELPLYDIHQPFALEEIEVLAITEPEVAGNGLDHAPTKATLMLVEDNEDFRTYLSENLNGQYTIVEASNGKSAFDKAISVVPDLIVSDIMMPGWDGVELCKRIKADSRTSHIPVILLTARAAPEQEIEGFHSGANDYITKPFSFEVLETRIQNLLTLRQASHKQFQKHLDIKISDIDVESVDEKLVRNAVKLVEENMANSDFSVEEMSRMLAMSRVHLYKKLFSLTGKTPIEFIRFIRIQRAAQLLAKSNLTVAEVAYQVGFNQPKYFARYFRDTHNMLPSQYVSLHRQKANNSKEQPS